MKQNNNKEHKSIQEAIDEAEPGATVTIPPGVYVSSEIVLKENVKLSGK